jgi:tripartite ATP-independent transporter DctM subunit
VADAAGVGLAVEAPAGATAPASAAWRLLEVTAGLLVGAITVLVTVQVFARYVLNDTPPWSEELCRYLFVWASFLGACVAMRRAAHLGVDSLVVRLAPRTREILHHAVTVVVAAFCALLVWQGWALVPAMASQRSPSMGVSLQYLFAVIPLAGLLMLGLQLRALVRAWASPSLRTGVALVAAGAVAVLLAGRVLDVSPGVAVTVLIVTMAGLIAVNTPIAFAVGTACVVYVLLRGDLPLIVVPHRIIGGMDSFLLLALPLFVLAGDLMNTGGITERLVGFARALVGHIRGGLGMTTVVSEYLFSGISGSSAADVSAVGSLLIPAMTRAGYRPELAVSIVAAASAMGVLVPPCLMMVILASLTDLSIAALFMAGFLPAAAMAVFLMVLIYVQARRQGLPREPRPSLREVGRACARGVLPLIAPVIILGGILGGIVTPTEAAVLAVIYALLLGLVIYREIHLRDLLPLLVNTASLTGMVMLLVGTASVLSWIFAAQGIPRLIAGVLLGLSSDATLVLLVTILVFVPLGAILEGVPAMIILVPVFFPIVARFGVDPLHYGILVVASLGLGLFVPPFGVGFFIACALGRTTVEGAARAYVPYVVALLLGLLLVAFVPWITLVVPRLMKL